MLMILMITTRLLRQISFSNIFHFSVKNCVRKEYLLCSVHDTRSMLICRVLISSNPRTSDDKSIIPTYSIKIIIIIIKQSFITRLLINTYHENERSELGLFSRENYNLKLELSKTNSHVVSQLL